MGNSQSTEAPKRQSHRLSKPRTSNHVTATAGLLSPSGFSNSSTSRRLSAALPPPPSPATSSTNSQAPESMRELDQVLERRPSVVSVEETESRRRSLFRSKSSQGPPKSENLKRNSSFLSSSRMADKLGRANSMTMTYESAISYYGPPNPDIWSGPPQSRASWNYDLSSYEAKRLLNLVEEPSVEHGTALSEHNMTVVTETTWKSSNPANPASTPITRANSDVSLYMPVRRRSVIQKPGIATRSNSARDGFGPPSSRPNFRYSHPPTPSLSRQQSQQSLDSYRSGVVSMPPRILDSDSVPRAVTPCEKDYQSIGTFKLGSLRITNGAASPVSPEAERHGKDEGAQGQTGGRAEYFLGVKSEAGLVTSNALQIILKSEEPPQVEIEAPQPRVSQWSPNAVSFQKGGPNTNSDVSDPDPDLGVVARDPTAMATDIPQYLDEISFSPFSLYDSPTPSPKLQTTSKTTALEAQLFDDEAQLEPQLEAEYSSVEVLDVRLDPIAKSQHGQASASASGSDKEKMMTVERTDSGFVSITSPTAADTCVRHKPLTKADSGYSSNVSLRSLQLKSQVHVLDNELSGTGSLEKEEDLQAPLVVTPSAAVPFPPQREAPPPPVLASVLPPQRDAPPPPVPPKDFPTSPTQQPKSDSMRKSLSTNTHSTGGFLSPANAFRNSKKTKTPTPIKNITSTLPAPNSPSSPASASASLPLSPASARSFRSDNSGSTLSISSGTQKPSKLQRLLSSARRPASGSGSSSGPLTVHATHVFEKTSIPSIPRDVEHKLLEHSGMFPITTKRLALKPRSSMDTLKTIFSVGSMEASLDPVNSISAAPLTTSASKDKEPLWRHTLQSVPSHFAHVAAQVIPRKPIARKPIPARQETVKRTRTAPTTEEAAASPSTARSERTMSLTLSLERKLDMKLARAGASVPNLSEGALPSPLLARTPELKTRTPPPVSMMNRRPGSLRVPPPLRSQSSTTSLNHRASRESLISQSSAQSKPQSLGRKTSRDNVRSYPSYQNQFQHARDDGPNDAIPPVPTMDPRRINAFRRSQGFDLAQSKAPNWHVQTDHDIMGQSARSPLEPVGRHNSLSPNHRPDVLGLGIQRSASAQGWKAQVQAQTGHPPLRHRSSYDGYSHQKKNLQSGHPPSMSNGYTGPPKPMPMLIPVGGQLDLMTGQWVQDGRYPPYVPRTNTHKRHRSMSGHGNNAPYRVLHSYNSPAYRNVPIWG